MSGFRLVRIPQHKLDEVVVTVLTPLGEEVGGFVWPFNHNNLLRLMNASTKGYYFSFDEHIRGTPLELGAARLKYDSYETNRVGNQILMGQYQQPKERDR